MPTRIILLVDCMPIFQFSATLSKKVLIFSQNGHGQIRVGILYSNKRVCLSRFLYLGGGITDLSRCTLHGDVIKLKNIATAKTTELWLHDFDQFAISQSLLFEHF